MNRAEQHALAISDALAGPGWCALPDFLPPKECAALAEECRRLWQGGQFREARVGRGEQLARRVEVRGDSVLWLDPLAPTAVQAPYFAALELLRLTLNRTLFLGLRELESHFACYPSGSFYKRHNDRHQGTLARTVTAVFYLNEGWQPEDGGQLRLFLPQGGSVELLPAAGTLACFVTADFEHEVLPARRERMSVTNWFRI